METHTFWMDRPASEELAGLTLNRPGGQEWALALGSFMINFGLLEGMTFWWIGDLAKDPELIHLARSSPFSKRVNLIERLLERAALSAESRSAARSSWREAAALSQFRNDLAHNPLVSWWSGEERQGPPDAHGIISYKKLKWGSDEPAAVISLSEIQSAITRANGIIEALYDRLAEMRRAPASPATDPPAAV
jgi:hypothetical protein